MFPRRNLSVRRVRESLSVQARELPGGWWIFVSAPKHSPPSPPTDAVSAGARCSRLTHQSVRRSCSLGCLMFMYVLYITRLAAVSLPYNGMILSRPGTSTSNTGGLSSNYYLRSAAFFFVSPLWHQLMVTDHPVQGYPPFFSRRPGEAGKADWM